MNASASPFQPRAVLGIVLVGALALLVLLYAVGAGLDGRRDRDGGGHGAANGLNGYAGLVELLQKRGHAVVLSRGEGRLKDRALLVLTPTPVADPDELNKIIADRRAIGPTLLILPKWVAMPVDALKLKGAQPGWVILAGNAVPDWAGKIALFRGMQVSAGKAQRWQGLGLSGTLPAPDRMQWIKGGPITPLVDAEGRMLAGTLGDDASGNGWPVIVVAEPDLLDNYALADRTRAQLAVTLVERATGGRGDLPILFDLTQAGLGRSENLLTLAFEPPFLAATLCLLLAAVLVGWRAFRRFGPPLVSAANGAMGKRELATNGAALVQRARRWHLLGAPYAALVAARMARQLGLRATDEPALLAALARRGVAEDYDRTINTLRQARKPADLLRAAVALRTLERTLTP
ncbi:MAG: hypothetical protein RLZZ08_531 [Pseudomonadota bacterium]|jgi:hypothetical protein